MNKFLSIGLLKIINLEQEIRVFFNKKNTVPRNINDALIIMAKAEVNKKRASRQAASLIVKHMVTVSGRNTIIKKIAPLLREYPKSNFLHAIYYICSSRQGNYENIGEDLLSQLKVFQSAPTGNDEELRQEHIKFKMLFHSWRVADHIARGQMGWACNNENGYESFGFVYKVSLNSKGKEKKYLTFSFNELLLQNKDINGYLSLCDKEFTLSDKCLLTRLSIIKQMIRSGHRRASDYSEAYKFAQLKFDALRSDWKDLLWSNYLSRSDYKPAQIMVLVDTLIFLLKAFSQEKDIKLVLNRLVELLDNNYLEDDQWAIAKILAREKQHGVLPYNLIKSLGIPWNAKNIRNFFQWAIYDRFFDKAKEIYQELPKTQRFYLATLDYVRILQRLGKFKEAEMLSREVFATHLTMPHNINPFACFSLMTRVGELNFAAKTSEYFKKVPQPKKPKGLILIASRNIDQMRRLPIAVLQEMKKENWAVIPLIEGVLPSQFTDDPKINVLINSISVDCNLTPKSINVFEPLKDFNLDIPNGHFSWGDIDLSHALWEDATVNRRRYNIEFNCPMLNVYLEKLAEWTRFEAMALEYAKKLSDDSDLNIGVFGLLTGRLPDAMKRSFCEKYGDPATFFSLTAANGYQNYFSNFSTPLSEKCVIRNMTLYPHVRSASFPIPELFEEYYEANNKFSEIVLERVIEITKVKRSTGSKKALSRSLSDIDAAINVWREKGGKVACAFGKVVCDSAVPFDGGPAHKNMKDWINHCIQSVKGSNTLLLIKPHPHEINNQIATFPNEYFFDLIDKPLNENVILLEHQSFDIYDLKERVDFGLIYNGTTSIELGLLDIPCILAGHFAPIDYPVGHQVPHDRSHFEELVKGNCEINVNDDLKYKCAMWLEYMSNANMTLPYRYCTRPVTNKVIYPPTWCDKDMPNYLEYGDENVTKLAGRALGRLQEPNS